MLLLPSLSLGRRKISRPYTLTDARSNVNPRKIESDLRVHKSASGGFLDERSSETGENGDGVKKKNKRRWNSLSPNPRFSMSNQTVRKRVEGVINSHVRQKRATPAVLATVHIQVAVASCNARKR